MKIWIASPKNLDARTTKSLAKPRPASRYALGVSYVKIETTMKYFQVTYVGQRRLPAERRHRDCESQKPGFLG
jgi:hypothetical protein